MICRFLSTLRLNLMQAGYPMLDDTLALLYAHPQVYVDGGIIVHTQPRPAFYRYLQVLVDAGFGNRIMFGSDQMIWPEAIERSVEVIEQAPFLSAEQKRDILYNNAARFLRLDAKTIARHRAMWGEGGAKSDQFMLRLPDPPSHNRSTELVASLLRSWRGRSCPLAFVPLHSRDRSKASHIQSGKS